MDIVNLAGTQKYNALAIFQRVINIFYIDSSTNLNIIKKIRILSNYYLIVSSEIKGKIKITAPISKKNIKIKSLKNSNCTKK